MSEKLTLLERTNIVLTLILSAIAVFLSYNAYRVSDNTFELSKKVDHLSDVQSQMELKGAANSLFTTIDMQRQDDSTGKDIGKCLKTFSEMKTILESQMKNLFLAQNRDISELWVELYSRLGFDIKFIELGLKPNHQVAGVKDIINELENKSNEIFTKVLKYSGTDP